MTVPHHSHVAIKELYDYWRSVSPCGELPGRQHIDPIDLAPLLPNIWLLEVHREPLRFWRRLVGTSIEAFAEGNLTGGWLHDKLNDDNFDEVQKALIEVVETKTPSWRRGKPAISNHKSEAELERIYLPLATDGETVDMILALTVVLKNPITRN